MIDQELENVGTFPAACHVEPAVNSFFSSKTQSVNPAFARWYKQETPTAPPPIINDLSSILKFWHFWTPFTLESLI